MELRKLAPWNWFKDEERAAVQEVPARGLNEPYQSPLAELHREIDRLLGSVFRDVAPAAGQRPAERASEVLLKPSVDIAASDEDYTITVEAPGVAEDDIRLELLGDTLTIRGEKRAASETQERDFYRVERAYGAFQRVLSLPQDADHDSIDARFDNGVLTITLKRKAVSEPQHHRVIDVRRAA